MRVFAGTYTVEFWHETLGRERRNVTVPATGSATLALVFKAAQHQGPADAAYALE